MKKRINKGKVLPKVVGRRLFHGFWNVQNIISSENTMLNKFSHKKRLILSFYQFWHTEILDLFSYRIKKLLILLCVF